MSIVYKCRHCGHIIGRLNEKATETSMSILGNLSVKDQQQMIHYQSNGDVHVHVICEHCEELLGHHPYYHELDYFIQ